MILSNLVSFFFFVEILVDVSHVGRKGNISERMKTKIIRTQCSSSMAMAWIAAVQQVLTDSLRAAVFLDNCKKACVTWSILLYSNVSIIMTLNIYKDTGAHCHRGSVSPLPPALTLGTAVDCCLHLEHMTDHVHAFDLKDCGLIVSLWLTVQLGMDQSNLFGAIWKWWRQVLSHLISNKQTFMHRRR